MIFESRKDYGTGDVLMIWDGEKPTEQEVIEHLDRNYGGEPKNRTIKINDEKRTPHGINPGTVNVSRI